LRKLIVSHFPEGTTEQELAELFRDYPALVCLRPDKYAVVIFRSGRMAEKALKELNGCNWGGHWLRVKPAKW